MKIITVCIFRETNDISEQTIPPHNYRKISNRVFGFYFEVIPVELYSKINHSYAVGSRTRGRLIQCNGTVDRNEIMLS